MRPSRDEVAGDAGDSGADGGLRRVLGLRHATAMVAGTIIGASIFVQPSEITARVPTVAGAAAVWAVAGVLTIFGALVCAELSSRYPDAGGVYVFLRRAWSPALGFLWGWAMFWTMHSGIIAAIANVFARYLGFFTGHGAVGTRIWAVAVILLLTGINVVGVRRAGDLQALFTLLKVTAIGVMIVVAFVLGSGVREAAAAPTSAPGPAQFLLALVAALFAFGGWHMVTYNAAETIDARRTIPRALGLGVAVVTVCYVALNAAYFHVLPVERVTRSTRVAADAADAVLGFGGGAFMAGLVCVSTFGALAGIVLAGPRVYWAMARDGLLFSWLGRLHPRHATPHRALLLQGAWASVLVATDTYRALFTRVIYTEWIFFGLLALGLVRLRRRHPDEPPPYRVPGYPLVPVIFATAAFAVVANQVVADPAESLWGLALVGVGWPVYHLWLRLRRPATDP